VPDPRRVFICYSHADRKWKNRLVLHLKVFERQGDLTVWHDDVIEAGADWRANIERAIGAADVAVFLISVDSLTSEFIQSVELAALLERREIEGLRLVPVLLRACPWESVPWLARLQHRPSGRALSAGNPHQVETDLAAIATEIANLARGAKGGAAPDPRLDDLYQQRADAITASDHTRIASLNAQIVAVKREKRAAGQLEAGDFLGDGRYKLVERRGKGGFATVWRAWDTRDKATVAIKVLQADHAQDRSRRERFFRGAEQMMRLDHPGIVRVLERHGIDGGWHYFVMEFIEGEDLDRAVRGGRVDAERGLAIVLDVAEALQFAHERKLVHRDVTPSNILLDREGRPHLTDFDLVRAADTTGGTRTSAMGKWVFAPPEMMRRPQDADARSDVYSLAMTLAFIYAGGPLDDDVLYEQDTYLAAMPCEPHVRAALAAALKRRMNERLASVADFVRALRTPTPSVIARAPSSRTPGASDRKPDPTPVRSAKRGADPRPGELQTEPATGISLVWIPPGEFRMGEAGVPVTLPTGFWIGQHPVTNEAYARFLAAAGHREPEYWRNSRFNKPDQPVVGVDFRDALAFCAWATKAAAFDDDREITLPTEAEWEYVARAAGGDGQLREYPWGNEAPTPERAVFDGGELAAVGGRPAGATQLGVHDLAGNVGEWCLDVWQPEFRGGPNPLVREPPRAARLPARCGAGPGGASGACVPQAVSGSSPAASSATSGSGWSVAVHDGGHDLANDPREAHPHGLRMATPGDSLQSALTFTRGRHGDSPLHVLHRPRRRRHRPRPRAVPPAPPANPMFPRRRRPDARRRLGRGTARRPSGLARHRRTHLGSHAGQPALPQRRDRRRHRVLAPERGHTPRHPRLPRRAAQRSDTRPVRPDQHPKHRRQGARPARCRGRTASSRVQARARPLSASG
jgi:formylglycine-generating enzyme required for sulfatase activity